MTQRDIFVVGAARTAIGTFGGALKDVPNTQLATTAVKAAIERSGVAPAQVGHLVMGNVIPTDTKDAYLSRVAAVDAGCPHRDAGLQREPPVRLGPAGHRVGGAGHRAGRLRRGDRRRLRDR